VAVASFVLSLLGVVVVSVPLALVSVLGRRPGVRRGRALATAALVVSAVWALAITAAVAVLTSPRAQGVVIAVAPSATPTPTPPPDAEPGTESTTVDIGALEPGDCIDGEAGPSVESAQLIPCDRPHDEEVIGLRDLPAGPWPGEKTVDRWADEACVPVFRSYVGIPVDRSRLGLGWYAPVKEGWEDGDNQVVCVAYNPDGKLTGTVRGSRR
jgi:hypothetical protein